MKLIFENAESHKYVDQTIMRICTAHSRSVGKFLEILPFTIKLILRCIITKYILQLRFLEMKLTPVSTQKILNRAKLVYLSEYDYCS